MPQRERNKLAAAMDPIMWRIPAGSPVWVAQKADWGSNGILQMHEHKMQKDMDFCGVVTMNVPGVHQPDYSQPRLLHDGLACFGTHRLRFSAPETVRLSHWFTSSVENLNDITIQELQESGYYVLYTGLDSFPFIICRTDVLHPVVSADASYEKVEPADNTPWAKLVEECEKREESS